MINYDKSYTFSRHKKCVGIFHIQETKWDVADSKADSAYQRAMTSTKDFWKWGKLLEKVDANVNYAARKPGENFNQMHIWKSININSYKIVMLSVFDLQRTTFKGVLSMLGLKWNLWLDQVAIP